MLKSVVEKVSTETLGSLLMSNPPCSTMSSEYFSLIGKLSSSYEGLELLKSTNIWRWLRQLSQEEGHEQLRKRVLTCLDYNMHMGPSRPLLAKCLNSGSKVVRALATKHMRTLLHAGVPNFSAWAIDFLVKRLSDPDSQVTREALSILDEASDHVECLKSFIEKKPSALLQFGKEGKNMLIRFLAVEAGFEYLEEINFIEPEVEQWRSFQNLQYAVDVDADLDEAFSEHVYENAGKKGAILPPHMYGGLAKTERGCRVLQKGKYFEEIWTTLIDKKAPSLQRRAALWAVGHIGESETGLTFVKDYNVINYIANLAVVAEDLSLRGTCFYVLGLLSRTEQGKQVLFSLGWDTPRTRKTNTICLPKDIASSSLLTVKECEYEGSWALVSSDNFPFSFKKGDQRYEITNWISDLSSKLSQKGARNSLMNAKQRAPHVFASHSLVASVFYLLETYRFALSERRFIYYLIEGASLSNSSWTNIFRYLQSSSHLDTTRMG